jgi:FAD/FMN-containing dehydrogenase/ribosomal protein S18 acetylase RimI-like enzyme/SAM-dependent methyltransferase
VPYDTAPSIRFVPAEPSQAAQLATLIYESSHELLDFMFGGRARAEAALARLLKRPGGHFGHQFARVMLADGEVAGVVLGYDRKELSGEELRGALNTFRATPASRWPHLLGSVGRALSGYVPPPSPDAFYINNIAVDGSKRGMGLGGKLLQQVVESSRAKGYRCIELDVTAPNEGAIAFYRKHGFRSISESGTDKHESRYGLPKLVRMRRVLVGEYGFSVDNYGRPHSTTVINDVTHLNPTPVDEVYAPGSVDQLQAMLRASGKPVSIGGGRFSMGGQTAHPGTLHIDLRGLNRILQIDAGNRVLRVQAGARWRDVQRVIDDYGLAVKVMQTYSNFTVGGSISVNCHGRYIGLGPLVLSLRSIDLVMHDGERLTASPGLNSEIFYGAVGGYGALGIIVEAELELAENCRVERSSRKMPLVRYPAFFRSHVRDDERAVFHNADMVPPRFEKVRAITWRTTGKPANTRPPSGRRNLYLAEKYMLWSITETPLGHLRREYLYEPLLYLRPKVAWRNEEANYDVAELEPLSRNHKTYVLQEFFVPVGSLTTFTVPLMSILNRYRVQVVNVSIRHSHPDPGTLLAWAREEVFALVLYYKQGTSAAERERVAVWTRELIDAVLDCGGTYYLPYQLHARFDQFHRAYPRARELFGLKSRLDPAYRFRNCLWDKYDRHVPAPLLGERQANGSEFLAVYGNLGSRDDFYRFLQTIYHLYPEHRFHQLIIDACHRHGDDRAIYDEIAERLPGIKPFLSELTHALPALATQKREMVRQTAGILPSYPRWNGYLEIGSTGRYVKGLRKALKIEGPVFLTNETPPDHSPPEVMERGGLRRVGTFFPQDGYAPIPASQIADESLDLVTCYIGLHHCPREKLDEYIRSIRRVLRPGGHFVLRDHDAGTESRRTFCSLVHTVFNAGLGVSWEKDREELRLFEGIDFWIDAVTRHGFTDTGKRALQENDPSLNTLVCFVRTEQPET